MGKALRTFEKELLIHLVYPQTCPMLPMSPDQTKSLRLQVLDTGMLNYFAGLSQEILGTTDLNSIYQGTLIKHILGQELLARQYCAMYGLDFWVREKPTSMAEVDYLFIYKEKLVPIEVKSGATGTLRSLAVFMDLASHPIAVRFYASEMRISTFITPGGKTVYLLNLPYYLVSQIETYLEWFEGAIAK